MTQEQINLLLAGLTILMPVFNYLLQKYFARNKDTVEYSSDLLKVANDAADALRKTREDMTKSEENYEKTIQSMQQAHEASIQAIRSEYDGRHERLKARIADLERVTKIYAIQFDLVTAPNVEIRNIQARAMDDLSASQKLKTITQEDIDAKAKKK